MEPASSQEEWLVHGWCISSTRKLRFVAFRVASNLAEWERESRHLRPSRRRWWMLGIIPASVIRILRMIELPAKPAARVEYEFKLHTRSCGTNQENKGLISVDRRAKPTLILTIPCSIFKSSAKDLSLPIVEIVIQATREHRFAMFLPGCANRMILGSS